MLWILPNLTTISGKLDTIINQLNDYTGDIITAIIGAVALIISVIIGSRTILSKLSEDHIKDNLIKIEENNAAFNLVINEALLKIPTRDIGPLHYSVVDKYYKDVILPLYTSSINASIEVCTGCYIIERLTYYLLKFRVPQHYKQYKNIKKCAFVDNTYFKYITDMLNLISYYSRESIRIPERLVIKKKDVDNIQRKLGGPKDNYRLRNCITKLSGVNYDPRFYIYLDLFKFLIGKDSDTIKAFTNIVDGKMHFIRACNELCVNGYTTQRSEYGHFEGSTRRVDEELQGTG